MLLIAVGVLVQSALWTAIALMKNIVHCILAGLMKDTKKNLDLQANKASNFSTLILY